MNYRKVMCLFVLLISTFAVVWGSEPEKITIAIEDKMIFPAIMTEGAIYRRSGGGTFIDALMLMEKKSNVKIEIVRLPVKRIYLELAKGRIDAFYIASYEKEREQFGVYPRDKNGNVDVSRRVNSSRYCLYVLKNSKVKWDGNKFGNTNKPVGAQLGYSVVDTLRNKGIEVEMTQDVEMNFQKLLHKRISAVAAHEDTGDGFLLMYQKKVAKLEKPVEIKHYYLMFSSQFYNDNTGFCEKFWDIMPEIRESSQLKELKKQYYQALARGK